jgi:hypothetical protein
MHRTDSGHAASHLQALQALAGALAGVFGSACNLKTQAQQALRRRLQALQAFRAGVRTCERVRVHAQARAGAAAQARAIARAIAPPRIMEKGRWGNDLQLAGGPGGACNCACNPCNLQAVPATCREGVI